MGKVTRLFDGLANALSGAGTAQDRRVHAYYAPRHVTPDQVAASYRDSWLMRRIVDLPPSDMTREWRDWQAESDTIEKIEGVEKRFNVKERMLAGLRMGRLGGGTIVIGLTDGLVEQPLPTTVRPDSLAYLYNVSRDRLTLGEMENDLASPYFGQPRWFQMAGAGRQVRIHPSRVIVFKGLPVLDDVTASSEDHFWGDPVYRTVIDAVQNVDASQNGFASMIDEAKVDIFGIPDLMSTVATPDGEARIMRRLEVAARSKSMHRALVKDAAETWEQRQVSWTGMPDVMRAYLQTVAGAADIPATRLLGKAPDGMNATGDGDERNYVTMIATMQESILRPAMEHLDGVLLPSAGIKVGSDEWWKFAPLSKTNEVQQSEIDKRKAETAKIYADAGLVPIDALSEAVCNQLVEDGTYSGLEQALDAVPSIETGTPDDLEVQGEALPFRRAANDAKPRSLYVRRDVLNVAEIQAWAREQGLPNLQENLHVTIAFSRTAVDWIEMGSDYRDYNGKGTGELVITAGGPRVVEPLGDRTAVLMFASSDLSWRNREMREAGASWDHADYQPHMSLTGAPVDLASVEPYRGKIVLGPEIFEEVVEDWEKGLVKA